MDNKFMKEVITSQRNANKNAMRHHLTPDEMTVNRKDKM